MEPTAAERIGREMGLRAPQAEALSRLAGRLAAAAAPDGRAPGADSAASLSFDTAFPSYCFQLATGVGKTRLMAACMAWLYRVRGWRHFLLLAPGETIYTKLRLELQPSHPKYLFAGLPDLARCTVLTGEDYLHRAPLAGTGGPVVCLFNIQKIWHPRLGARFRFHRYHESLGGSFADWLRGLPDLTVLMDESHRYRGPVSLAAVENLQPRLGLEFTATPAHTGNVIMRYPLARAVADGYVKAIRAVCRPAAGADGAGTDAAAREEARLADGLACHRRKRAALQAYCRRRGLPPVRPVALISTADIAHGRAVQARVEALAGGEFRGRTLLVHSRSEAEALAQLLRLEQPDSRAEVVIHVNKLREGWDVRNIYTIIPLRASISQVLTEQTLGRGVRLPFGQRTGDPEVDTLDVICHAASRDPYARVARAAMQVGGTAIRAGEPTPAPAEQTPHPAERPEQAIPLPRATGQITARAWLEPFTPTPLPPERWKGSRGGGGDGRPDGPPEAAGLAAALTAALLWQVDELGPDDREAVAQTVAAYLAALPPGARQAPLRAHAAHLAPQLVAHHRVESAVR